MNQALTSIPVAAETQVYTVSNLSAKARALLEENFQLIWVTGEISNLSRPASGHLYFSLKDARAQIRCAMFKNQLRRISHLIENGQQVLLQVQVSLYETRGDFQLIVMQMQLAGAGALQIAFEQLKAILAQEGLFAPEKKKVLPTFPQTLGVITSASGAALQDILKVARKRCTVPIIIYPTLVQGPKAAIEIVAAIKKANLRRECNVLILARGGGSIEDLWPFNEAIVARAIFQSRIPIVTGIGHETDFTIADFVSDCRAPTPSAAAVLATPDQMQWCQQVMALRQRLIQMVKVMVQRKKSEYKLLEAKLKSQNPTVKLKQNKEYCRTLQHRLQTVMTRDLIGAKQNVISLVRALNSVNPLATLQRGYAIVTCENRIIRNAKELLVGNHLEVVFSEGQAGCRVETISSTNSWDAFNLELE